jgi:hypothetical protein
MNAQHLGAFLWLRWRLRVNAMKRSGTANLVIGLILAGVAVLLGVALFFIFLLVGTYGLSDSRPAILMYVWDGLVVTFLFIWATGVMADLQRAEALSLDKFLHLPVSLAGAFVVNYLSSLLSFTLILFVPAMLGLSLGLILGRGPGMVLLVPLVAAFFLMVTALTYQFQGWLAALMANKRRRQTVIVLITAAFILLSQLPNLINVLKPWKSRDSDERSTTQQIIRLNMDLRKLEREFLAKQITVAKHQQRQAEILRELRELTDRQAAADQEAEQHRERVTWWINLAVPPGWLPLGAAGLAEGNLVPALLGTLGLTLIGAASLWRSYRTTVRLYTGQFDTRSRRAARAPQKAPAPADTTRRRFLERQIPFVSEQASAVALAGFRSLLRAPEGKMMLLSPLILMIVFGGMFLAHPTDMPEEVRPLVAFGAMSMALFTLLQVLGNQFGFDRDGFRVYVLSPAHRRDILLGKNLAFAPLALGLGSAAVVLVEVVSGMRVDHFLATLPQLLSMYLVFCLLANCLSILAPMRIAPGLMRPSQGGGLMVLLHLAFLFLFPMVLALTLLPLAVEFMLRPWVEGLPIYLVGSVAECVAIVYLYRLVLTAQGDWLQAREQKILKVVTTKAE